MQDMPMGKVHATTGRDRVPARIGAAVRADGCRMVDLGSERTGRAIRHQISGREKIIGKLPVDGWCSQTNTAYQFHGCYYHGHPCTRQ